MSDGAPGFDSGISETCNAIFDGERFPDSVTVVAPLHGIHGDEIGSQERRGEIEAQVAAVHARREQNIAVPVLMPPPRHTGLVSRGHSARLDGAPAVVTRFPQTDVDTSARQFVHCLTTTASSTAAKTLASMARSGRPSGRDCAGASIA
jgi:hypothetical protein